MHQNSKGHRDPGFELTWMNNVEVDIGNGGDHSVYI